jgi:hypothetical protein
MDLASVIAYANIGLGLVSVAGATVSVVVAFRQTHSAKRASDKFMFLEAIRSDDILQLGGYLENTIGSLTVTDFSRDKEVRRRVERYLDHIVDFLNRDTAVIEIATSEADSVTQPDLEQEIDREIDRGENWNALARLRRHIEQVLRSQARVRNLDVGERSGPVHLIERLRQADAIDSGTARELVEAVALANRAIHGEEVPWEEASRAVSIGLSAISRIGSQRAR